MGKPRRTCAATSSVVGNSRFRTLIQPGVFGPDESARRLARDERRVQLGMWPPQRAAALEVDPRVSIISACYSCQRIPRLHRSQSENSYP
jgi:hypothetical protein